MLLLNSSRKLLFRHLRLEILLAFSYGFRVFEALFLIKFFLIKKRVNWTQTSSDCLMYVQIISSILGVQSQYIAKMILDCKILCQIWIVLIIALIPLIALIIELIITQSSFFVSYVLKTSLMKFFSVIMFLKVQFFWA